MSCDPFIYPGGYASGEAVLVVDGTFKGTPGKVVSPDEAVALRDQFGGQRSIFKAPPGRVWVVLPLFGRTVPVLLAPRKSPPAPRADVNRTDFRFRAPSQSHTGPARARQVVPTGRASRTQRQVAM